ncbi:hypothetical protein JYK14_07150 [Siccirubricoccus sp. KC 17139]|uniref:Uncharacterized protein n=1 Tax=Siccirubricoccus soli TaxID=2899147 RepID=A0ABT1D241_9PROT|nr:hypothetical protein [Siccirubricoccus soli]MCO6415954.1 hypothetical protein [Siccirubricoccus soli]MCP2682086.1 hypothetical protein [Siccirubricoccus soli]
MPDLPQTELRRVFEAARRFVAYRARAAALAVESCEETSLAEAIERDFLLFDLGRAEHELREAVLALDPDLAAGAPGRPGTS